MSDRKQRRKDREQERQELTNKRELAKTGMVASLGGVLLTGMMKKKKAHIATSVAFLGFAYWHSTLYPNKPNKKKERPDPNLIEQIEED